MKKLKTIRCDIQLRKEKYKKYPCSSALYLEIVDNYILTAPISATEVVIPIRYDEQLGFILDGFLISFNFDEELEIIQNYLRKEGFPNSKFDCNKGGIVVQL